jgi:hypothetical protein
MKNLTITLDDDLFAWARVEAARRGQSLSRFVSHALLERRAPDVADRLAALNVFLDGPGWPGVTENLPSREDLYDRPAVRRHESADLRDGPDGWDEAGPERMASEAGLRAEPYGNQPADPERVLRRPRL